METNLEKIRDIKSVINEFYHERKCRGGLSEGARNSWLCYQQDCDDIKQDLKRLETLEKENQMLKITILEYESQQEVFWEATTNNANLRKENYKLKKAIKFLSNYICVRQTLDEEDIYYLSALFSSEEIDKQTYDLLEEVLE